MLISVGDLGDFLGGVVGFFFSVLFLCFMAQLPYDQWHGSLALAKPITVRA